jgi:thiamine-phosphate pyrophosphorylase
MLLYYITDRLQFSGDEREKKLQLLDKIAQCAVAGVDYIQLREKDLKARELQELAKAAARLIPADAVTRLLINSRIDVALACGINGVHLPANDLPASEARALFGKAGHINPTIGVSSHKVEEVAQAEAHGADFAVFGPVFEKNGQLNPSVELLKRACNRPHVAANPMPVLALGGITIDNVEQCLEAGAAGIAGIRLFQQNDVQEIVMVLRNKSKSLKHGGKE